jgi:hypothetical protein
MTESEKRDRWAWTRRLRVWEANRKALEYPENFVEPERREGRARPDDPRVK